MGHINELMINRRFTTFAVDKACAWIALQWSANSLAIFIMCNYEVKTELCLVLFH